MTSHYFPIRIGANLHRTFVREVTTSRTASCDTDALCLSDKLPLLRNVRQGLIDPDTPSSAKTKTAADGTKMNLVVRFGVILMHSVGSNL